MGSLDKITAVIVDDEPEARGIMARLLADFTAVEVISAEESVNKALKTILGKKPDMIFLDIEMPKKDGFDLVRELKSHNFLPTIVFVTAYNQFAIEAIRHAAFDYLVKPVDIEDLKQTVERFKSERKVGATLGHIESLLEALQEDKLKFNTRTGYVFIYPADIIYCEADGNYTHLFMINDKKQTVTTNIGRLETVLPRLKFMKVNRSVMINKQYLAEINRKEKKCILRIHDREVSFSMPANYMQ